MFGVKYSKENRTLQNFSILPIKAATIKTDFKMYTFHDVDSFHISEPADTYIYDIVPVAAGLAVISSDDSLRLLDPESLNGTPINSIRKINTDVTCLTTSAGNAGFVYTAGRDGRVCIVDPRTGAKAGEVKAGKLAFFCVCFSEKCTRTLICENDFRSYDSLTSSSDFYNQYHVSSFRL